MPKEFDPEDPMEIVCDIVGCQVYKDQKVVKVRVVNERVDATEMYLLEECGHWVMAG